MGLSPDQSELSIEQILANQFIARYEGEPVHVSFERDGKGQVFEVARDEWGVKIDERLIRTDSENK